MAGCAKAIPQWWCFFVWLIILTSYLPKISIAVSSEEPKPVQVITLQSCCRNKISTTSSLERSEPCQENVLIPLDLLKSYRIPRGTNSTSIPINNNESPFLNENTSIQQQQQYQVRSALKCDGILEQIYVPALKDQLEWRKGFFTFFSQDGHFQFNGRIFDKSEFCVERFSPGSIELLICSQSLQCSTGNVTDLENDRGNMELAKPCIIRCCDYGQAWNLWDKSFRCDDSGKYKWEPKLYPDLYSRDEIRGMIKDNEVDYLIMHPRDLMKTSCKGKLYTFLSRNPTFHENQTESKKTGKRLFKVLKDGSVWIKIRKREWIPLQPGEYCLDGYQYGAGNYSGNNEETLLFECKTLETKEDRERKELQRKYSLVFGILLVFCLCFLLMTTLVYILLWNIHGWTVFAYIVALLATYIFLGISHFLSVSLVRSGPWTRAVCGGIGIMCHFTFLSTFSWSTVLNFDLWRTFRSLRPSSGKSRGVKKFLLYCLFALSIPTSIVTLGIILDVKYRDDVENDVITPEYGQTVCYVEPRFARLYFVIYPIAVLLSVNLLFFCITAYSVYKVKKSTRFASSSSTKSETGNQTFRLILKLLLVNGSIWVVEIVSWYLQTDYEEIGLVSFVLDIINVLQAVAIFFLFVFKNDILDSLKRTYPKLQGTVDFAYKIKNFGRSRTSSENPGVSTDTSQNTKTENLPVTKL